MSSDIRGYYALLGVAHDATAQSVKAAFRKLAKEHHPDTGVSDGGARFRAINEAYAVLGDPTARAAYDSESATEPAQGNSNKARVIDPITCGTCGQVTAQPRYVVFRHVISFILGTVRTPIQGIYCVACARKAAFRANLITALAGWWGFPWGPIWTIAEGFKNALGAPVILSMKNAYYGITHWRSLLVGITDYPLLSLAGFLALVTRKSPVMQKS